MTSTVSKRALFLNVPDPAKGIKLASEAFLYGRSCVCPEPFNYNYDQYGRHAPYNSLNYGGNGSWASPCTQGTPQHLQERIRVENVQRPYIDFSMEPGFAYDAMGVGRDLIECRSGGVDCSGGWKTVPMARNPPSSPLDTVPVYPMKTMSGFYDPSCMHYAYANRYTG